MGKQGSEANKHIDLLKAFLVRTHLPHSELLWIKYHLVTIKAIGYMARA